MSFLGKGSLKFFVENIDYIQLVVKESDYCAHDIYHRLLCNPEYKAQTIKTMLTQSINYFELKNWQVFAPALELPGGLFQVQKNLY